MSADSGRPVPPPGSADGDREPVAPSPSSSSPPRMIRTPKYSAFIGTGVVVGVVLGVILTVLAGDRAAAYSLGARLGYLCAIFALLGALVGGAVAVLVERARR